MRAALPRGPQAKAHTRRWTLLRAALTRRRILALAVLALLTTVLWTASAHAAPTPTPAPTVTGTSGSGAAATGTAGSADGTGGLSDADKDVLDETARLGSGTPTDASRHQALTQATDALRKELPQQGGVLGVFDATDRYGIPLSVYTVNPGTGGWSDWQLKVYGFLIELAFMGTKWAAAFLSWLLVWALGFGLANILLRPVLEVSAALNTHVVVAMGLPMLCLTVAGTICAWHILLGDRTKGVGELALTLLIAGVMLTSMASPATQLMGGDRGGLLGAAQGFSLEVAEVIINADPGTASGSGGGDVHDLARPITDALADAFVVKPAQLLEYGQTFTGDCASAYAEAKLAQLAYDRKADGIIQLIQDSDSPGDLKLPGMSTVGTIVDPTGFNDWAVDKVVSIAGSWVKDHYGHPPMSAFEDKCVTGDVGAAKKASVDKVAGAFFVLLAAVIVGVFICRLAGSFLVAQCRVALESIRGELVMLAGLVPGGGRTLLWQWCGTLLKVFQLLIMSVLLLAVFLVVITTLLDPSLDSAFGNSLSLRFIVLDIVSIAVFIYRNKVAAAARQSATGLRSRLENSRIGGAGGAIFRTAHRDTARRSRITRGVVTLGALALSGGTATTVLGSGRHLARRLAPARGRGPQPRPVPRTRPGLAVPHPPTVPPPPPPTPPPAPAPGLPPGTPPPPPRPPGPPSPRARRAGARPVSSAPAASARQEALRRRLGRHAAAAPRPPAPGAGAPPPSPAPGPVPASPAPPTPRRPAPRRGRP
ncbi:hypothetical protein ACWERV_32760 [Streptomyces sp. NPDC004031]